MSKIEKGILRYFSNLDLYGVEYGWHGYCTSLDDPERYELRLDPAEDWLPLDRAPLQDWVGKVVELKDKWEERRMKKYRPLEIDFEIPEILQRNIEEFIQNLNERNGNLADCYEEEIRSLLNCCDADLNENQIELLRAYYCKGGIYEKQFKAKLKEYLDEETKSTPEEELKFWEKMKSDERLDAATKLAIEERIKDLQK